MSRNERRIKNTRPYDVQKVALGSEDAYLATVNPLIDPLHLLQGTKHDQVAAAIAATQIDRIARSLGIPSTVTRERMRGQVIGDKTAIVDKREGEWYRSPFADGTEGLMGFGIGLKIANRLRDQTPRNPIFQRPTCGIIASFRYKNEVDELIDRFSRMGLDTRVPPKGDVEKVVNDFKVLAGDLPLGEPDLEPAYIQGMSEVDAVYIYDREGYMGKSARLEAIIAQECGIPIFAKEPIQTEIERHRSGRDIRGAIQIASPDEFMSLMLEKKGRVQPKDQFWVKRNRGRFRIFGFTDDRLRRSWFADFRDIYTGRNQSLDKVTPALENIKALTECHIYFLINDPDSPATYENSQDWKDGQRNIFTK